MSELSDSTLDLYLSGTKDDILMIEMCALGSDDVLPSPVIDPLLDPTLISQTLSIHKSNALPEDELIEKLSSANTLYAKELQQFCRDAKPLELTSHVVNEEIVLYLIQHHLDEIKAAIAQMAKSERSTALRKLRKKIIPKQPEWSELSLKHAIEKVKHDLVNASTSCINTRWSKRCPNV